MSTVHQFLNLLIITICRILEISARSPLRKQMQRLKQGL